MSESAVNGAALGASAARPRARGGKGLSAVLPGIPQLLAGRWGAGGTAALAWIGLLWIAFTRPGRMGEALGGP